MRARPSTSRYQGRKILLTGASGFIAARLAETLGVLGADVDGAARHAPKRELPGVARFHCVDLSEPAACRQLVEKVKPEIVFHMASHVSGRQDLATVGATLSGNLVTTVNLLTSLADVATAQSIVIAGSSEEPRTFEHGVAAAAPTSPYAAAKLGASAYAAFFRHTLGLPICHARIFMGYGPGQYDLAKLIPYVTVALLRGQTPKLSSGTRLADFTFIDDIVSGLLTLAAMPEIETLDFGTGRLTSVGEIAAKLRDIIDPGAQLGLGANADRINEPERKADIERSARLSGWQPKHSVADGLQATVDWYRQHLSSFDEIAA